MAGCLPKKPRTYRHTARRDFLRIVKRRKKPRKLIRRGLRQQLNYVRRNLGHIDRLIETGATLAALNPREYKTLLVIHDVYRQQQHMYDHKQRRIDMDNGPGSPEELRSQIFNLFFTTKDVGKDTGIGLSISYKIVTETHNGKIWYEPVVGQSGTQFFIEIPIS